MAPFDSLPARSRIPAVAQADFRKSYEGLDLTPEQQRILTWFETWDQPTLNAMADVIRVARAENPTTRQREAAPRLRCVIDGCARTYARESDLKRHIRTNHALTRA